MLRKLLLTSIFFLIAILLFPYNPGFADEKLNMEEFTQEWTLERYTKYFYNRYSTHLDEHGFFYRVPDYGINDWKAPSAAREYMAFSMYYKYRAIDGDREAKEILEDAIYNAYKDISTRPKNTQSFEDAEALFLMIRALDEAGASLKVQGMALGQQTEELEISLPPACAGRAQAGNWKLEIDNFLAWIASYAEAGIKVPDTENRAIISAVHWQYIIDYLGAKGYISLVDRKRYEEMLRDKIDFAIKTNIKDYWYIEGRFDDFTPHYHAVAAYMLMIYSKLTADNRYSHIAEKMYKNLKASSFDNGMIEARLGHRPRGLGAQFYLMAGMLGKVFGDSDYTTYLFYGFGDRFFSDPTYPNRLEYHSTIEGESPCFHDDYSFVDAAELALAVPSLAGFSSHFNMDESNKIGASDQNLPAASKGDNRNTFHFTCQLTIPEIIPHAKFIKKNTGREIIFGEKKFIMGSYGNYSRKVEN
ncbi:MAG: hypothetical protein V1770_04920 [bacterium]